MPSGLGHLTYLALGKETTWGTAVAPTVFVPVLSVSPEEEADDPKDEALYGVPAIFTVFQGLERSTLEWAFHLRPQPLCHVLRALCGPPTSTQPDPTNHPTVWRHTFKWPRQSGFAPNCWGNPYTLEVYRDIQDQAYRYPGCCVSKLSLSISADDKVWRGETSWIGKGWPTNVTKGSPTYPSVHPWLLTGTTVTVNASGYGELSDLTLALDEKLEGATTIEGVRTITEILPSERVEAVLSGTSLLRSSAEYDAFRQRAERTYEVQAVGQQISGSYNHTLKITMPRVRYTSYPVPVPGAERLTAEWEAAVLYSQADGAAVIFEITTDVPESELS